MNPCNRALLLALGVGATCSIEAATLQRLEFERPAMGTRFRITMYADDASRGAVAAEAAFARVEALNRIFSDYLPDSEVRRLSETPQKPVRISSELFDVVAKSLEVAALTDGAFDITAGPLTQLWRRSKRQHELPSRSRLEHARALTNWRCIELDAANRTLRLPKPGMQLDLGGVAKGFAADEALAIVRHHGIPQAVVVAGGDLAIGDAPPASDGWEVRLRTFTKPGPDEPLITLHLARCGVSTSGDLYQFVEIDGRRYSHIIDPKTGLGLTVPLACTVIAPNAITSDVWDTALCVMGVTEGLRLCERLGTFHARFVELQNGSPPVVVESAEFPQEEKNAQAIGARK